VSFGRFVLGRTVIIDIFGQEMYSTTCLMKNVIHIFIVLLLFIQCTPDKTTQTVVTGKLIDRPETDTVYVLKAFQDWRYEGREIAVSDSGTYRFTIPSTPILEYHVVFQDEARKGAWRPVVFFNDTEEIHMELYPLNRYEENKVLGSWLTQEKNEFEEQLVKKYMPQHSDLRRKISGLEGKDRMQSKKGIELQAKLDSLATAYAHDKLRFIMTDRNPMKYRMLLELIKNRKRFLLEKDSLKSYQQVFATDFPTHPYNEKAYFLFSELKAGDQIVDFVADNEQGNSMVFSDRVKDNDLTLLDLWAPYCSPCIQKSKKVIPFYEKYHDKGFEVVAVIGGISNKEKFARIKKKYAYPWKCYSEINNRNQLWEKYDIEGSGGAQFLINNKGKVIAINPEINELEAYLKKL
jgi:thiol-disulfide isomerase/thioredoxin